MSLNVYLCLSVCLSVHPHIPIHIFVCGCYLIFCFFLAGGGCVCVTLDFFVFEGGGGEFFKFSLNFLSCVCVIHTIFCVFGRSVSVGW